MKIKINGLLGGFVLALFAWQGLVYAAEPVASTASVAQSKRIVPLGVTLADSPDQQVFLIEIFAPKVISGGGKARFSWYDENNVPVGSYIGGLGETDVIGLKQMRVPRLDFVGEYRLQVEFFSTFGSVLAQGGTDVVIDSGSERLEILSPLLIKSSDGFALSFDVRNYNLAQEVVPRLQGFFMKDGERKYVLQRKLESVSLAPRGTRTVEFVVEEEFPPGEYYLETWLESSSGRYLSGVAESYLQLPGSYARLNEIEIALPTENSDALEISFDGFALLPPSKNLKVRILGRYQEEVVVDATAPVPVSQGYFVETVPVELKKPVPFFTGEMQFYWGDNFALDQNLLTQVFNSPDLSSVSEIEVATNDVSERPAFNSNLVTTDSRAGSTTHWSQWLTWGSIGLVLLLFIILMRLIKKRKSRRVFGFLLLMGMSGWSMASAQPSEVPAACFADLKVKTLQIADFAGATGELAELDYQTVSDEFSPYYQGRSSFGIDVDQGIFDMRLYSFGRETGYIHPPYSPFPVGTQSEQWKYPAKEFIVAEEYVRDPDGERQFLGCAFFRIAGKDLSEVTRENYLYDGPLTSVLIEEGTNKYWYNLNTSYNRDDELMAYWYRLFVYPRATQNDYFSRYAVMDSFPHRAAEDFTLLTRVGISARNQAGVGFPELEPAEGGEVFFLQPYYQAITDRFPDFAERLALRGFLEYENLQKVLASPNTDEFAAVWDTVLDSRDITRYALAKEQGEPTVDQPFYDSVLANPYKINEEVEAQVVTGGNQKTGNTPKVSNPLVTPDLPVFVMVIVLLFLLFAMLAGLLWFNHRRK